MCTYSLRNAWVELSLQEHIGNFAKPFIKVTRNDKSGVFVHRKDEV